MAIYGITVKNLSCRGEEDLLLKELLDGLPFVVCSGDSGVEIKGIAYDSRRVGPGFLFVAVKGFAADGHDFILHAQEMGAVAAVVEREVELPPGMALVLVNNSRQALSALSARYYGYPSRRLKLIGITGTNGKTTTSTLLASVYRHFGRKAGLIGTVCNIIGDKVLPVTHTTPESADLQALLAEMAGKGVEACAMEVSSHALALHRVEDCEFDVAVFTNLSQDHLDFHSDMQDYLQAKLKLFEGLVSKRRFKPPGVGVVNIDDPQAKKFIEAAGGAGVVTYSAQGNKDADVFASGVIVSASGTCFTVEGAWGCWPLALRLTGGFNVANALAAFAAACALGLPPRTVVEALGEVRGVPGRFEVVNPGGEFIVVVDYAHTPDGLLNVLTAARRVTRGKLITVFGCGGDRDRKKRPVMGDIAVRLSDYTIITSDNPRTEDPLKIIGEILAGIPAERRKDRFTVEPDRRLAIRRAIGMAGAGDVVIIAGKGHEDYQIIGTQKLPFDDRKEALAALAELGKA